LARGDGVNAVSNLVAAKLVKEHGARRTGVERELFIKKSNSFVACARLYAKNRGCIHLENLALSSLSPDWSVIETQIRRLAPPHIEGPPLVPDLWSQ